MAYESVWGNRLLKEFNNQLRIEEEDYKMYFWEPIPEILYHYSKDENLKSIINSNLFRASNIRYLNDISEYHYGIEVMRRVLTENQNSFSSGFVDFFIKQIGKYDDNYYIERIFILSLSTDGDCLPLWREYSGLDGHNIGLDLHFVLHNTPGRIRCHGHVVYSKERQEQIILEKATKLFEFYNKFAPNCDTEEFEVVSGFVFTQMLHYVTLFKHPAFEYEKEYRFVYYDANSCMEKRNKPYFELNAKIMNRPKKELSLVEICMGPHNINSEDNTRSVLLNEKNTRDIRIYKSDIPLRYVPKAGGN